MPEGPSIVILREEAAPFVGRRILRVGGNTRLDAERLRGQTIRELRSWGKHFLIVLPDFSVRVHFLLWGSYRIDQRRAGTPRLSLGFARGRELNFYACSLRFIEEELDRVYDWSADVMSDQWSPRKAHRKLAQRPGQLACDALLDQDVFAGCGNIIKNEVLFRIRVHPLSRIDALPARKRGALVAQARDYSFDFYAWKKAHVLKRHWQVHAQRECPRCRIRLEYRRELGRARRRAFFCGRCQILYE